MSSKATKSLRKKDIQRLEALEGQMRSITNYVQQMEIKRAALHRVLEGKHFTAEDFQNAAEEVLNEMNKSLEAEMKKKQEKK